eukprot:gnl/Hemi2/9555_TR3318_c0_g1_i1.p1 gnl/Hemi2/9555_TR3318_c0_g1~~gnl/Hemi2/9555_TR3318_c0_g1_i1.p1  ORF type:complete len:135 (-),score=43.29 gnl/Hemi2/9555_TR3318_c0_g1_i1:296-700(-)
MSLKLLQSQLAQLTAINAAEPDSFSELGLGSKRKQPTNTQPQQKGKKKKKKKSATAAGGRRVKPKLTDLQKVAKARDEARAREWAEQMSVRPKSEKELELIAKILGLERSEQASQQDGDGDDGSDLDDDLLDLM